MTTCLGHGCVEQSDVMSRSSTVQGCEEKMCNSMHKKIKFARDKETSPYFSDACTKHNNICIEHTTYKVQLTNLNFKGAFKTQDQLAWNGKAGNQNGEPLLTKHLITIKTTTQTHPDLGIRLSEIRMGIIY